MSKLNASEAIYGFVGWMTCREENLAIGANSDASPFPPLIDEFCKANDLDPVTLAWPSHLIHPNGEVAIADKTEE